MSTEVALTQEEQSFLEKAGNAVQKVPKPVWWVLGLSGAYWLGVRPILNDVMDNSTEASEEFDEDVKKLLNKPTGDGSTYPSITETEAQAIADAQFESMSWQINDETELVPMLEKLNGKDLQWVFIKFNARPYNTVTGGDGGKIGRYLGQVQDLNLFGWYKHELKKSDVRNLMRQIWAKGGYAMPF